jgi:hypothetical protein
MQHPLKHEVPDMPQAIFTAYHGPTNTRGSRVSAKCEAGRLSLPWDDALDSEGNHKAAAQALIKKLGWDDRAWAFGSSGRLSKGETFVPVLDYNTLPATRRKGEPTGTVPDGGTMWAGT